MNYGSKNIKIECYNATHIEAYSSEYIQSGVPLFTEVDIEFYDWREHFFFFLKESALNLSVMNNLENNHQTLSSFATTSRDKFYLYVNDELIYTGYYSQSGLSSFYADGITMQDIDNGVLINADDNEGDNVDYRMDDRLFNALKSNKILK